MGKLFGALLLILVGIVLAGIAIARIKAQLATTDAWLDLIYLIRTEIDCYLRPIGDILAGADEDLLRRAGGGSSADTLDELLSGATPHLSDESVQLLESFVRELGTSYRAEQVKRCDYYIASLRKIRETLAASLPSRTKLYSALCICGALGAVILLW